MVIDFEEAEIVKTAETVKTEAETVKPLRQALEPISPNRKRKRAPGGAKEVGAEYNILETMNEDPRIQYHVEQEILRMRGLGKDALRTIRAQESAGLGVK